MSNKIPNKPTKITKVNIQKPNFKSNMNNIKKPTNIRPQGRGR